MAKSYANLWPQIVSWENLLLAYRRCRRRKRYKRGAVEFDFAWERHLLELQQELQSGSYVPGAYRHFYIHDPKRRKISAAPFRDRVVHHAIVNVLEPLFEQRFIFDSYACRRGKGTHRALDRAQGYLGQYRYCLKTDIIRFFPNVDHGHLLALLQRTLRDAPLLRLIEQIINSGVGVLSDEATPVYFPGDDLLSILRPTGLPIGNLTSQFFANVLLDPIDHFIKERLRIPGYVRYADDLLLFADSKTALWESRDALAHELQPLRQRLHPDKTQICPSAKGVGFLGFRVTPTQRRLLQSTLRRFRRRCRQQAALFQEQAIPARAVRESVRAWLAHISSANSRKIRNVLLGRLLLTRSGQ